MLILASGSSIRRKMLQDAGIEHQVAPPEIDEDRVKVHGASPDMIASELAWLKALSVSADSPEAWVIGSDSVVSVDGKSFDKPKTREQAVDHLRFFSGRTMVLTSAVALAKGGSPDWSYVGTAELRVRPLSAGFIERYLEAEWPEVGYCVGVFRLEGRGVHLFEEVRGDFFTILGMPLIPLLGALREREILSS